MNRCKKRPSKRKVVFHSSIQLYYPALMKGLLMKSMGWSLEGSEKKTERFSLSFRFCTSLAKVEVEGIETVRNEHTPLKWTPKNAMIKRSYLFQSLIFGIHVRFLGCTWLNFGTAEVEKCRRWRSGE